MIEVEVSEYRDGQGFCALVPRESVAALRRRHLFPTWIFGVADELGGDDPGFGPGSPLAIVPEPKNKWNDPNCLAVENLARTARLGYVPPFIAKSLSKAGGTYVGIALYEQLADGRRVSAGMLVGPQPLRARIVHDDPVRVAARAAGLPRDRTVPLGADSHDRAESPESTVIDFDQAARRIREGRETGET